MTPPNVITGTALPETSTLKFVSRGKVRDLYEVTDSDAASSSGKSRTQTYLLFIATDRISAYDVILQNGVPGKGALLTRISNFWFARLRDVLPNHVVASTLEEMPAGIRSQLNGIWESHGLEGRTLLVMKAKVVKLEVIVRGYLTGSAWSEYKKSGTVHGLKLREGYVESDKLDEPLFTPSTKADQGEHDENVSPERAQGILRDQLDRFGALRSLDNTEKDRVAASFLAEITSKALTLFDKASKFALSKGLILADTKFEFGIAPLSTLSDASSTPNSNKISQLSAPPFSLSLPNDDGAEEQYGLLLIDEALTPDSSRYWSAKEYKPGGPQASFDKQYLRDWLVSNGFRKGLESGPAGREGEGWVMSEDVVKGTRERYEDVVRMLDG